MAVGVDFGTTNSSVAVADTDGRVRLARFHTSGGESASFRSLLLFTREAKQHMHCFAGPQAMEQYRLAEDDARRLIQSLKSYLPVRALTGTEVFGRRHAVEDLLARILKELRVEAEAALSITIREAVVGRPVRFVGAETPEDEAFALQRLEDACHRAGFQAVRFEYEPVGAALAYESTLDHQELVLIGDFGGGTSDFSLLRVGPGVGENERVLGTSGVGLAGDAFDAKLVRHLVTPSLGAETMERSGGKLLPAVPAWIYRNLERWHYLSFLRTRNVTEILKGVSVRALEPEKIEALRTIIDEDLGLELHNAVERLKVSLSEQEAGEFRFDAGALDLRIPVTRAEFESWITEDLAAIEGAVVELLRKTGVAASAIDRVFLTGGTSYVPAVARLFDERFGPKAVRRGEAFTAVAHGLGLRARELFSPLTS